MKRSRRKYVNATMYDGRITIDEQLAGLDCVLRELGLDDARLFFQDDSGCEGRGGESCDCSDGGKGLHL